MKQSNSFEYEIIVVDNASTDGSCQAIQHLYPEVILIQNANNVGFSKANNIGIRRSTGQYVCIVNSDTEVLTGINSMIEYMDKHRNVGVLGPKILNKNHSLRHNCREFPSLWTTMCLAVSLNSVFPKSRLFSGTLMTYFTHDSIRKVNVLPGCFLMVRRKALHEVGLLDERFFIYGEDKDWCKRFWDKNWQVVFFHKAEVVHFAEASSSRAPVRFAKEKLKANYQYWDKHHGWIGKKLFLFMMIFHHSVRLGVWSIAGLLRSSNRGDNVNRIRSYATCLGWLFGRIFTSEKT